MKWCHLVDQTEDIKVDILLTDIKSTSTCIDLNLPFTLQCDEYSWSSDIHTKKSSFRKSALGIYQKGINANHLVLPLIDCPQKGNIQMSYFVKHGNI